MLELKLKIFFEVEVLLFRSMVVVALISRRLGDFFIRFEFAEAADPEPL